MSGRGRTSLGLVLPLLLCIACRDGELEQRARAACDAVDAGRFEEALAGAPVATASSQAARDLTECRCLASMSLGNAAGCTDELGPRLAGADAADWVPHPLLAKLMLRTWARDGRIEPALALVSRSARAHPEDLELLQLELRLRGQAGDEDAALADAEARLDDDARWFPQRLVLAQAWLARLRTREALRVLGDTPPAPGDAMLLPWYEIRIQAQASAGDLPAVQRSFAQWRESGADPVDLAARYALRLSVSQLFDPEHSKLDLLRAAIATQDQLRDPQIVWGLHRRLIAELLAAGLPEQALAAYDEAVRVVEITGITREEIERAIQLASGGLRDDAPGRLRFTLPQPLGDSELLLSPGPDEPPDAGYARLVEDADGRIEVEARPGLHPRRWVWRDASGVLASGSVWPAAGAVRTVAPRPSTVPSPLPHAVIPDRPRAIRPQARPGPPRAGDGRRRVFAVLPDCGDWRLTEYLRARGDLPFHDHLFGEGYRAVLTSRPAFTAAALQSLVWPGPAEDGGTLGWVHRFGLELAGLEAVGRNPVEWLAAVLPTRANLFETLGAGPRVAANMLLAHGHIDAGRHAETVGPEGARGQLAPQRGYRGLRRDELERHPGLAIDAATRRFAETIAAEMDAAEVLAEEGAVDFLFLRLESLDLITHAHYGAIAGSGQDDGRGPLLDAYRYIDERLAALHARLDEDDWLVVLSDHGIRSAMEHEEDAIFAVIGSDVPHGRAPGTPDLSGVPRSLAAMLGVETNWPETGATPWLRIEQELAELPAHP